LKKNEMQIGGKDIVNMFVNMMLKQKPSKWHKSKNTPFCAYLFWNGLKQFKFGIVQIMIYGT
jgi:hypothetical protein